MIYSSIIAILFLAASTVLTGCGSLGACGMMPTDDPLAQANWRRCVDDYEKEEQRQAQEAFEAEQAQDLVVTDRSLEERRQASLDAVARWQREVEDALKEANSPSPDFPKLAWLNGMWCGPDDHTPSDGIRWKVVGTNSVRLLKHSYYPPSESVTGVEVHSVRETTYTIKEQEGYYELVEQLKFEERETTLFHEVSHVRKDSDSTYTHLYESMVWNSGNKLWREFEPDATNLKKCLTP